MYADSKGTDQPVHQCSLIGDFIFRFLQSMVSKLALCIVSTFQLVSITEQLGLSMPWTETLRDMFSCIKAHMIKQGLLGILHGFL